MPIFLHVGVVHLLVNMVAQMLIGAQIEKEMGEMSLGFWPCRIHGIHGVKYGAEE